jgi:hypothetical protein
MGTTLLVQIPDVDMPFPGFRVVFPVNNILGRNDLAAGQGQRGTTDLDHGVSRHFCRDCGEARVFDVEAGNGLEPETLDLSEAVNHFSARREDVGFRCVDMVQYTHIAKPDCGVAEEVIRLSHGSERS